MHQATEYAYDANGSLTADRNKGLTGIAYNHLSLPKQIRFGTGADSIVFRYTAAGQKVAKLVYQTGQPTRRTDYLGPYQYEQDSLRFFPHAEGRVLRFASKDAAGQPTARYQREFSFKDHLGNLRLAYRAGLVRTYAATLEPDAPTHARESQQFDSLSVSPPVAQNVGSLARTGSYAARLNAGGPAPQPLGPLTQLPVQKGDTLFVTAPGRYQQATSNHTFSLLTFIASLLQPAPAGTPPGLDGSRRGGLPLLQVGLSSATLLALNQLPGGVPKAYLRVLSFNQDSVLVDQRTVQLTTAALGNYETLSTGQLIVQQDGYVSVYVGNESATDVYFDDVTIEHRQGLQVQENHYDPFGLDLAGVSGAAPGLRLKNFYQFNGKENQLDLGLNWNHQDARFYDYQLGRWHVVDPDPDKSSQEGWGTYHFGFDNPLRYEDADGHQGNPVPGYPGDSPMFYLQQGFADMVQNAGAMIDKAGIYVNAAFSWGYNENQTNIGGQPRNVSTSTEIKGEVKFAPKLGSYLNSRTPSALNGPTYIASASAKLAKVNKAEVATTVGVVDVKAAVGTKIDGKTGKVSKFTEASVGKGVGKYIGAGVNVNVTTDSEGKAETKVGVKAEARIPGGSKVSVGAGLYNTGN